jgi:NNP family nitrate/nitrite transporter-like MFS transporter
MLLICAFLYYNYTQDSPNGNFSDFVKPVGKKENTNTLEVLTDWRVWVLALAYSICFGMEITFDNVAALYFVDTFNFDQKSAGLLAGLFGFMNIFARALGGIFADRVGRIYGISGKGWLLAGFLVLEGIGLYFFSNTLTITYAILSMLSFALFLKMANGATYAITPFINSKNVGLVAGIVGAGGNIGGMLMGFLFKSESISYAEAFQYIGGAAVVVGTLVALTKFAVKSKEIKPTTVLEEVLA